uniref:Uncharacterized protein n=1 Tax=Anopheles dirus TaxID=7168 RepID=A0A182NYW1_9DIPT
MVKIAITVRRTDVNKEPRVGDGRGVSVPEPHCCHCLPASTVDVMRHRSPCSRAAGQGPDGHKPAARTD